MKLLKVKPFQETLNKGYCGPAVLKMVLKYYGVNKTERELAKLTGTTKVGSTNDKAIAKVLHSCGLKAKIKNNSNFSDLKRYLNKGIPAIVDWYTKGRKDYSDSTVADGHYSVVVGLDKKFVYLQDPEIGKIRKLAKDDFLRVWFDYSGEFLNSPKQMIIRQSIAVYK
ncbi:MAG: putative fusion protein (N:peptidase-C:desuccinylase) [Parcubacteria group bacterium Gr01-1014_29]|nr:MAG: putative fusion protein (N:peptidase-C:desuccinylase) [Parcubacteria group bacterium Gr01-1014_29]